MKTAFVTANGHCRARLLGNLLTEFSNWLIMAGYIRVAQTKGVAGGGPDGAFAELASRLVRPHFELME